jgi:Ca-activated chloride channel family protein
VIGFQWGGLLVLLALVPILIGIYVWAARRRRPAAARYSSLSLIRAARPGPQRWRRHVPFALFAAAIGALVLAMARPTAVVAVPTADRTIVLALDVSRSMCAADISPTRLQAAQAAAIEFVGRQPAGTRIGVVAFSGFAAVIQVPSVERGPVIEAIASLTTGRRTAVGSGILSAIDAIAEVNPNVARSTADGRPGTEPPPVAEGAYEPDVIVLLTDGATNAGIEPEDAAAQARTRGLRVFTIGFGTEQGGQFDPSCAPQFIGREPGSGTDPFGGGGFGGGFGGGRFRRGIDEDALIEVAELTGGTYSPAESAGELSQVLADLPTTVITRHEPVELSVGFVALAGLLAAGGMLLGRAWRPLP